MGMANAKDTLLYLSVTVIIMGNLYLSTRIAIRMTGAVNLRKGIGMRKFDLAAAQRGEPIACNSFSKTRFVAYDEKLKAVITATSHGNNDEKITAFYSPEEVSPFGIIPLTTDLLMMYEPIRKQFDYGEYIKNPSGWRLETRDGCLSEFIGFSEKVEELSQVVYIFVNSDGDWGSSACSKKGAFNSIGDHPLDLFMIEVTP